MGTRTVVLFALASMLLAQEGGIYVAGPQGRRRAGEPSPPRAEVKPEDRGALEGTVLNLRTGEPVRKAQVMLFRMDAQGDNAPQAALTDPAGRFRLAGVDPGRYRITVWRSGFARPEMERRRPGDSPTTLTLAARQTLKDLVFKLSPAAVIAGRVLDEDGDPVSSAQVQALRFRYLQGRRQLMPSGYASSDDQGNYRMHSLVAGRYYLRVSHPEQRAMLGLVSADSAEADQSYAALYYPGVLDPNQAVAVQVREGEERRAVDFRLVPVRTVRVRGRILNPPATHGRGVMVSLQPRQGPGAAGFGVSYMGAKPDGSFELRGIVPGSYVLWAQYAADRENSLSARRPVEVGNANVDNLEVTLRPGAELTGHVSSEGAADSKISLEQMRMGLVRDQEQRVELVATDGSFKLTNIGDGDYRVVAYALPQDCYLKSVRLGGVDALDNNVTVSDGAIAGKLEVVISAAGGKLDGSLTNDKHEAAPGVTVVLAPEGRLGRSDLFRNTASDQNGRFSLRGLPPGDYLLYAWEDVESGAWEDPAFLEQYKDQGKRVTIGERTQQNVELTVIPAADPGK